MPVCRAFRQSTVSLGVAPLQEIAVGSLCDLFYGRNPAGDRFEDGIIVKSTLRYAIRLTADLLFPARCVHCGVDGELFCQKCEADSTRLRLSEVCKRCGLPSAKDTCEACFLDPPSLDRVFPAFAFDPSIRDAITAFKYNDIRALAPRLGSLLADALPESTHRSTNVIIPVPISRSRLRHRGYNQSELLARQVSDFPEDVSVPVDSKKLVRLRDQGPQANAQSLSERTANMIGTFEAVGAVSGVRILLVDDVMTSGSTLNACASALKEAGAAWVGALVLAREL